MKIVWLAPYPIDQIKGLTLKNPSSKGRGNWLVNSAMALAAMPNIDLHIISYSANVNSNQVVKNNNCTYHILKHSIPFTNKGFPYFFRADILFKYKGIMNKMKKVIHEIHPDVIHAHGTENAYAYLCSFLNYPCLISVQGIIHELNKIEKKMAYTLQESIESSSFENNKNFACRTAWDTAFVKKKNPTAKIYYLGEALNKIFFERKWEVRKNHTLLFLATIVKRKGIEDLIQVVGNLKNIYPDIHLKVIGQGDVNYIELLKQMAKNCGVENNISWMGFLNSSHIAEEMLTSRAFVLPSYADNSPNSLAEAMAIGLPSIAYSTWGIPSMIKHEQDGLLCETGNKKELELQIKKILDNDNLCKQLSDNSIKTGLQRNYPDNIATVTADIYNEVINTFLVESKITQTQLN